MMSSAAVAAAMVDAAACHAAGSNSKKNKALFRFHEDRAAQQRFPFDRIDENQEEECGGGGGGGGGFANCDIMHLIMSSSSLSLSNSASSILSTPSLTIKRHQQQETDDSASSSSTSLTQPPATAATAAAAAATAPAAAAALAAAVLLEQQRSRRLLLGLHHGATCCRKYSLQHGGACPNHARCAVVKRLYSHILHCRCKTSSNSKECCMVPGCTKARKVWAHFGRCIDQDCSICTVIPNRSDEKRSLSQKYKTTMRKKKAATATYCKPVAATTSFSKTTAFQMSSLVAAIAASMSSTMPMREEHPAGRPPLSPTRSFTAPFYCYI
jgi:TAZ zinc finger